MCRFPIQHLSRGGIGHVHAVGKNTNLVSQARPLRRESLACKMQAYQGHTTSEVMSTFTCSFCRSSIAALAVLLLAQSTALINGKANRRLQLNIYSCIRTAIVTCALRLIHARVKGHTIAHGACGTERGLRSLELVWCNYSFSMKRDNASSCIIKITI